MADRGGLDDEAVRARLARVDALLEVVEQAPGPTSDAALEAVRELVEVYGEALARLVRLDARSSPRTVTDDELLNHLLVLHDLHPEDVGARIARALRRLPGGPVELVGFDPDSGVLRLKAAASGGCGCGGGAGAGDSRQAVEDALACFAAEVTRVELEPAGPAGGEPVLLQIAPRPGTVGVS